MPKLLRSSPLHAAQPTVPSAAGFNRPPPVRYDSLVTILAYLDDFWGWLPGHVYPAWLAPNAITCAAAKFTASRPEAQKRLMLSPVSLVGHRETGWFWLRG